MDSPVGVALFGAGMIAPTHVTALSALRSEIHLDAIVSQHPEKARHLAKHYEGLAPVFTNDLNSILDNPDVKVAVIATPPSIRMDIIEPLAKAGKHILMEKPIARTTSEALRVVETCESANVKLGVVFQHRMRKSSMAAASLVKSGKLGKLGLVEISVPLWRDQTYYDTLGRGTYARDGGGVLLTQAIHTIDLALSLTGDVSSVQAMTATTPLHKMEAEDFAVSGLRFASGAVGSIVASTAVYPHRRETITLHFEKGSLYVGSNSLEVCWRDGRYDREVNDNTGTLTNEVPANKHQWHQAVIEDFLQAVRQDRQPKVSGREAFKSHQLIEAIETSSQSGSLVELAPCH